VAKHRFAHKISTAPPRCSPDTRLDNYLPRGVCIRRTTGRCNQNFVCNIYILCHDKRTQTTHSRAVHWMRGQFERFYSYICMCCIYIYE